jgi:hypothetical protein
MIEELNKYNLLSYLTAGICSYITINHLYSVLKDKSNIKVKKYNNTINNVKNNILSINEIKINLFSDKNLLKNKLVINIYDVKNRYVIKSLELNPEYFKNIFEKAIEEKAYKIYNSSNNNYEFSINKAYFIKLAKNELDDNYETDSEAEVEYQNVKYTEEMEKLELFIKDIKKNYKSNNYTIHLNI